MDLNQYRKSVKVSGTFPVHLSVIDAGPLNPPGRGTIVCIHGAGGTAEQWQYQIEHLAPHYRVVAPDLRGHGRSEVIASMYSLEEFLWDFTQLLTLLKVEQPFTLMAHSFGGPIAMTFAGTQPERVGKLVLIATAPEMHLSPLQELVIKSPLPLSYLEYLRPVLWPKTFAPIFVLQRLLGGTLFRWRGYDILSQVRAPALLIAGEKDHIVSVTMAERMKQALPDARLELVRHARHLPHIERPDAVNRLIDRFLEGSRSFSESGKIRATKAEG